MKDLPGLYDLAKSALRLYRVQLDKYIIALREVTEADINYDSVKAFVTTGLEASATSKTALKDMVLGNPKVLTASEKLQKKKSDKETIYETMKYLEMVYQLHKKAMDTVNKEQQYLGG